MSADQRTKVLLVVTPGRSGTTILDRILGQYDGVFAAGELTFLWSAGLVDNARCGCGSPLRDCATWRSILSSAFGSLEGIDAPALAAIWHDRRVTRLDLAYLASGLGRRHLRRARVDVGVVLESLYAGIAAATGRRIVVDTSKGVLHALVSAGRPGIEPYLLHLVRDPRAVVHSWRTPKAELGYGHHAVMRTLGSAQAALLWDAINNAAPRVAHDLSGRYLQLRYEDFVREPEASIASIARLLGEPLTPELVVRDGTANLKVTHSVWGNPMRFETGLVPIRADERWRDEMPRLQQNFVSLLTSPWLRTFGYDLRPPPAGRSLPGAG